MAMKGTLRGLVRVGTIGVIALIGLPVALLIPSVFLDRSPSGGVRTSLFPLALAFFDPFVWACAWNSVAFALIVTVGSLVLGVALARTIGPWRFWGRPPLATIAWLPLAVAPAFAALGLMQIVPPVAIGRSLARLSGRSLLFGVPWSGWISWLLWIWVGLASATPVVALSVKAALGRIASNWADAGLALGASRRRAWRQLVWPIVRPEVARTLAAVFAAALLEPGAPLILGLRRTMAFQMVESVTRDDPSTRIAILALIGFIFALAGRALIRWWGGSRVFIDQHEHPVRPGRAGLLRSGVSVIGLTAWIAFGLTPLIGLGGIVIGAFDAGANGGWIVAVASLVYALIDPDTGRLWANALMLGVAVVVLDALLVTLWRVTLPASRRISRPSLLILGFERTPPLIFGVAAALVPGLISLVADRFRLTSLDQLTAWLDPIRWPGVLLIVATAATRLPTLARASDRADLLARPVLTDAALSLGETRRRSIRLGGGRGPSLGVLILTLTLATTSIAPAIVLSPTTRTRPLGPGFVLLTDDRPKAAGLALGAVCLNLIGLIAARRGRSGPAGDWFRG